MLAGSPNCKQTRADTSSSMDSYWNSYANAKKKGLVSVSKSGAVTLRTSTKKYANQRDTVRLVSKQTHSKGGLFLFDVAHIPAAFGSWPSAWMTGYEWVSGLRSQGLDRTESNPSAFTRVPARARRD